MPAVDVIDLENNVVGSVELADQVFGVAVNEDLLYHAVRHYQAGRRAGTHKVRTRSEVSGSGRKPWRQKGTGRARAGSIRSPLWRGGGTVHGPTPRDYSYHLPKKMLLGALRSALTVRLSDGALKVVKEFSLASAKTKDFNQILDRLDAAGSVLLVDNSDNENLRRSSRNIPGVRLMNSRELHPYHLLGSEVVLISEPAVKRCCEALA
jgi:large subunit ribosomal protein L4